MEVSKFLPFPVPAELQASVDQLEQVWREMRTVATEVAQNWWGYGISLANPLAPSIMLFVQNDVTEALLEQLALLLPLPIAVTTGIVFTAIPSKPQSPPAAGIPAPGAQLNCVAQGGINPPSENGSLGAFVTDSNGVVYILSANHVLAFNNKFPQVSINFGGSSVGDKPLGVPLTDGDDNRVDVAISRFLGPEKSVAIPGLALANRTATAPVGGVKPVQKFGAGSGSSSGTLTYYCPRVKIALPSCRFPNGIDFINQYLVEDTAGPFSDVGDSGSLAVVGKDGAREPFGMLIAQGAFHGGKFTVVTPFNELHLSIKDKLKIDCRLLV